MPMAEGDTLSSGPLSDTIELKFFVLAVTLIQNFWSLENFTSDDVDWAPEVGGSYGLVGFGDGSGKYHIYQGDMSTGETTLVTTGIINGMNGFSAVEWVTLAHATLTVEDPRPTLSNSSL